MICHLLSMLQIARVFREINALKLSQIFLFALMAEPVTEQKKIIGMAKIFMAQYLSQIHGYQTFQEGAVDLLAHFMINTIKILAVKVKRLLDLQGRTLANPLHMLAVNDLDHFVNLESLLEYIIRRKSFPLKEFEVIRKCSNQLFKDDIAKINSYQTCTKFKNISYVPSVFTSKALENPLPYRHPIHETISLPKEFTYQSTRMIVTLRQMSKQLQQLEAYHRRQIIKAKSIFIKDKKPQKYQKKVIENLKQKKKSIQKQLVSKIGPNQDAKSDPKKSIKVSENKEELKCSTRKSTSLSHSQVPKQIRKTKSTVDLTKIALPLQDSPSEDHKIAEKQYEESKKDTKEPNQDKQARKNTKTVKKSINQPQPEKLTLKKAIQKLKLSQNIIQDDGGQKEEPYEPQNKLVRRFMPEQSERITFGQRIDENGKGSKLGGKKNKFELISFL